MSSAGSVTQWISLAKDGDSAAVQSLWQRYFPKLVRLARQKLAGVRRGAEDEEDVAQSAFKSFCLAARRGRFPNLTDRDSLWRLLLKMTARKAVDLRRREMGPKRGGGKVLGESAFGGDDSDSDEIMATRLVANTPTPEFAALVAEEFHRYLKLLDDPELRAIELAKMEGYTNDEICEQCNCAVRTVERRLRLIRKKWKRHA